MSFDPQDIDALLAYAQERGIFVRVGDVEFAVRVSDVSQVVAPSNQMAELGRMMMIKFIETARRDAFEEGRLARKEQP